MDNLGGLQSHPRSTDRDECIAKPNKTKHPAKSRPSPAKAARTLRSSRKATRKITRAEEAPSTPTMILAPVDFSQFSNRALQYALTFAERFDASLVLLHVVEAFPID